jgi:hypothetical protein
MILIMQAILSIVILCQFSLNVFYLTKTNQHNKILNHSKIFSQYVEINTQALTVAICFNK